MSNFKIKDVVKGITEGIKGTLKVGAYGRIENFIDSLNCLLGRDYFSGIALNKVYSICGVGVVIEFTDAENKISILSTEDGDVVSCRVIDSGFEGMCFKERFGECRSGSFLVMEGAS